MDQGKKEVAKLARVSYTRIINEHESQRLVGALRRIAEYPVPEADACAHVTKLQQIALTVLATANPALLILEGWT